jgi:hypothetical protein
MLLEELMKQLNERVSQSNPPQYKIIVSFKDADKVNGKFYCVYDPAEYSDHADLEAFAKRQGKVGGFCRFVTMGKRIVANSRQYEDIKDDVLADFITQMRGKKPAHHIFIPMVRG